MPLYTLFSSRLLASALLMLVSLGLSRAQAQQPQAVVTDPAVLDPTYTARKDQQVPTGRLVQAATTAQRGIQPPGTPLPECFEPLDKTTYTPVPRNDDGSLGPINLGFQFFLFGTPYSRVYINTNGNITFNAGLSQYNAAGFPVSTPMLAPFWADEDTRTPSSGNRGQIWYRLYNDRLVVTWDSVGYFSNRTDKKNNFQLTIYANAGGTLAQDVVFAYGDMQWTTGNASGGVNGFGGTPATAGINEGGSGGRFTQIGRFNTDGNSFLSNTSTTSGVDYLDYKCFGFRVFNVGNQPPSVVGLPTSRSITVNQGQTVTLTPQFTGPEPSQTVQVTPITYSLCNASAVVGPGSSPVVNFSITGAPCNIGTHTVVFNAEDNGSPVASSRYTLTVVVNPPISERVWEGDVSSDYLMAANWQNDMLPQPADSVLIPASSPHFPVLEGPATTGNLTIAAGARMSIGPAGVLTVNGHLRTNGPLTGTGTLSLGGSARQYIGGASPLRIGELRINAAGALQLGSIAISRVLDLAGVLTTNGRPLTLLSDASTTAMVINRGVGRVIGDATVQRYISPALNPGLGYRHLSAPVSGITMGAIAAPGFAPILNTAYNAVGNMVRPFPNMFGYDQSRVIASGSPGSADFDRGFFVPAAVNTPFADAKGYTVNIPSGVVLSYTGALHNGTFNSGLLARGTQTESGWHLLGNPFPAPIDWDAAFASATGLENAVYVFKSSGQYAGSYESYVNGIGTARYIGLGQAFFVRTAVPGTSGTLNLNNSARVLSYQNPTLHRQAAGSGDQRPQLRLELLSSTQQQDAAYVYFENGATAGFDRAYDAVKLPGGNQLYLATGTGGSAFSINGLPALSGSGTAVPLLTYLPAAGAFTLRVGELKNFNSTRVQLEDRQTGLWHELLPQTSLSFQASRPDAAATRFVLHFGQPRALGSAAAVLPTEAVSLWPNPASQALNVSVHALPAGNEQLQLTLLNLLGQVASTGQAAVRSGSTTATLDLNGLAPGVYTLRGSTGTHTFTRSVVVR